MELRLESRSIQDVLAQASQLLKDRRLVVVFGDRLSLTSFALAEPIRSSLVGAATTEDEGVELVLRTRPDLLICSSDLEIGYGVNLLRRVKEELPTCQLLIVLVRETREVVQEAMLASADGVIFKSSLGTGHGDLIGALQTIAKGGVYYPAEIRSIAAAAGGGAHTTRAGSGCRSGPRLHQQRRRGSAGRLRGNGENPCWQCHGQARCPRSHPDGRHGDALRPD